jgi:hypothetical protein
MTYEAKITIKYDSTWEQTNGIYDEEMIPEEHITFECPAHDLNTTQLFKFFEKFALAMGYSETTICDGACALAFNEMRSMEDMRKTANDYDLKLIEDYRDEVCELEAEIRNLKGEIIKLKGELTSFNSQYTDDDEDEDNKLETLKKLKSAYKVCLDCGHKYGVHHNRASSWWHDNCDVCGKENVLVTEARDFSFLKKGIEELSK